MKKTILTSAVTILMFVAGCVTNQQQPTARTVAPKRATGVTTVSTKPSWLLIGGVDVDSSRGGDMIRVSGRLSLFGVEAKSYEPETDPLTITFFSGGRIVYWKGKGEITKLDVGQRVVLPLVSPTQPMGKTNQDCSLRGPLVKKSWGHFGVAQTQPDFVLEVNGMVFPLTGKQDFLSRAGLQKELREKSSAPSAIADILAAVQTQPTARKTSPRSVVILPTDEDDYVKIVSITKEQLPSSLPVALAPGAKFVAVHRDEGFMYVYVAPDQSGLVMMTLQGDFGSESSVMQANIKLQYHHGNSVGSSGIAADCQLLGQLKFPPTTWTPFYGKTKCRGGGVNIAKDKLELSADATFTDTDGGQ